MWASPSFTFRDDRGGKRLTDNRGVWAEKEIKRLFPNGDHQYILSLLYGSWSIDPYGRRGDFKPREFKKQYDQQLKKENEKE